MSANVLTPDDVFNILNLSIGRGQNIDRNKVSVNQVDKILIISPYLNINGEVEESKTYVVYNEGYLFILPRVVGLSNNGELNVDQGGIVDISAWINQSCPEYMSASYSFIASINYISRYSVDAGDYVLDCAVVNYCPISSIDVTV